MSILIKGMEMPKSCHDCRFCGWSNFWQAYDCHMTKNHALLLFNGEKTNIDSKTRNGRADNCPLVPVPPHGRLGDLDALDVVLQNEAKPFGYAVYECGITDGLALARECVETAPTVIQAEEGK